MPMKVVFVLPSFAGGGAQKVMVTLAGQLDRNAYAPCIVVLNDSGPWQSLVPKGLRVLSLGESRLRAALPALVRALRAERPDVIVSSIGYMNMGVLLARPFLAGRPRIVVREANDPGRHARDALGRLGYRLGYRWLYKLAALVLCPASYIRDILVSDYGVAAGRIVVLPNPVDETAIRAAAAAPRRSPGSGLRFICIGRLTEQKGYDRLLDDMANLPADARLTIFGDGELESTLHRQIERLGLGGRVALAGFEPVPGPWLAGADALLLPSRWEGLPNVALEALACGTPVIATPDAGGIAEIAGHAEPGAVTLARSGAEFVSAMTACAVRADSALRSSMLPDVYRLKRVVAEFSAILGTSVARPPAKD